MEYKCQILDDKLVLLNRGSWKTLQSTFANDAMKGLPNTAIQRYPIQSFTGDRKTEDASKHMKDGAQQHSTVHCRPMHGKTALQAV